MSQSELGAAIGVTFQQIQKYENGRSRIGVGRLVMIAEVLGLPPSAFFTSLEAGQDRACFDPVLAALAEPETRQLLETFASIPHPDLRQKIVALSTSIAGALKDLEP